MLKASSHQRLVCSFLLLLIAICQCAELAPFPLTNEELSVKLSQLETLFHKETNQLQIEIAQLKKKEAEHHLERLSGIKQQKMAAGAKVAPSSCTTLAQEGINQNGYYLVSAVPGVVSNQIKTIFCNFDYSPDFPGYETTIANNSADYQEIENQIKDLQSQGGGNQPVAGPIPTDCNGVKALGWTQSGFYTVKGSSAQLVTVYCDFTKTTGVTGYEKRIGYVDVKTSSGVYFYVGRYSTYSTNKTVITYNREELNIGNAMNLTSGVFTAPVSGRYQFNFVALTNYGDGYTEVLLRLNEIGISIGQGWSQYDTLAITSTLALQKGETIDTLLWSGSIYGGYWTQFTGILLEEDLVLS